MVKRQNENKLQVHFRTLYDIFLAYFFLHIFFILPPPPAYFPSFELGSPLNDISVRKFIYADREGDEKSVGWQNDQKKQQPNNTAT